MEYKTKHKTREQWLNAAADLLRPIFKTRAEVVIPKNVRMACGFTSQGARGRRIGECWSPTASADAAIEIFIKPTLDDGVRVLGILVHELVHAGVGNKHGHDRTFGAAARAMLLEGKLTATTEGEPFKQQIAAPLLKALGEYPHGALGKGTSSGPKKQATRLLKCFCPECDYVVRITAKWANIATPDCPNPECGKQGDAMKLEE